MTTLNQLFQELNKVKVENKKAHKKRVEKYNLIETPNELNVEKEIDNIFSQINVLKDQVKEHENKRIIKEEENKLLGDLEELLFKEVEQKTENVIEEISEELPVEEVEQKTEEKSKEILIDEIKPKLELINQYTNHITQEENKKDKNVLHERTNYDILNREIELLKKRISSLSTQLVTNSTQYLGKSHGDGGGELNLVNPIKIYEDFNISGYGGNDVFLCFTHNNDINIYLPNSDQNYGMKVHVKKMHRDHQLYIRGYNDNQLIDEKEFITVTTVYLNYTMVCDGKDWYIVGVSGSGGSYIHDQSTSAITWTINHNLDTRPVNIVVTDRNYNLILIEDVEYVSSNTIEITFPSTQDGWATVTV